jgi:site-specific recombinase XerD
MEEVTRNSYSLYQRQTGNRTIWYARFWDDELQAYSSGRSTGQTTKAAANRQVQKWLTEGLPESIKRNPSVSQKRILTAISKYLCETGTIEKTDNYETEELIKLFYTQVTNQQMSSAEGFIDYLLRFWDWNGDYVRGRLERKKSIGKKYVDNCRSIITMHIAPYFKDMSLADVTTLSLENFMRSIPRRDDDPENGYSRRTINIMMKTIKKPLADAVRLRIIPRNPADGVELLADDTRERGIVTPSELERLFQLEWADERGKTASILAAVSGMRLSEITGLQINNLDKVRNIIHVLHSYTSYEQRLKTTKTGKTRIIYTDSSIIELLEDLHTRNPHEGTYIFWGLEPNKPIRSESIEKYLESAFATLLGEEVRKGITDE